MRLRASPASQSSGLWFSRTFVNDTRLVIGESGIDAVSYRAPHPEKQTRYASIGGQVNPRQPAATTGRDNRPRQPALRMAAIARMTEGAEIIAALGNDDADRKLAALVESCLKDTGRKDLAFSVDLPGKEGLDWNDLLKASCSPQSGGSSHSEARSAGLRATEETTGANRLLLFDCNSLAVSCRQ